ncbi:carboxypeptidase B-like [Penaeus vannamei]|uniref:carboxypeptidase B-like n=1 Tax=Penaeus vannamei TaxID=6689 RepID=UPI00387F6B7F
MARKALLLLLAQVVLGAQDLPAVSHRGWRVLEVSLEADAGVGDRDRSFLRSLEDRRGVDLLRQDGARGVVEIAVPSEVVEEVTTELEANNMTATTIVDDLARIMSENASIPSTLTAGEVTFSRFMTYEEIVSYVEGLPQKYPERVQLRVAGMSEENRPIYVVVVASAAAKADEPVIVVDGGAHAREWVSPAAALFLVSRLLESPALAQGVEWRILPLLNPDGYVYSWTDNRLWRKNRAKFEGHDCIGVDLNRNFDYAWGGPDSSPNPCTSIHMGRQPFSERESRAVRDVVLEGNRTQVYVTLHSYGQEIILPWVSTFTAVHPNHENMSRVGEGMARAIEANDGTKYRVGNGQSFLYSFGGTSVDWAAGVAGVPLVFAMELRDMKHFIIPDDLIQHAVEDVWVSMKYVAEELTGGEDSTTKETKLPGAEIVESPLKEVWETTVASYTENGNDGAGEAETTVNPDIQSDAVTAMQTSTAAPEVSESSISGLGITNAFTEIVHNALNQKGIQDVRKDSIRKPTLWEIVLS